jgi:hypothetical protein
MKLRDITLRKKMPFPGLGYRDSFAAGTAHGAFVEVDGGILIWGGDVSHAFRVSETSDAAPARQVAPPVMTPREGQRGR